jgi:hypothetical protein
MLPRVPEKTAHDNAEAVSGLRAEIDVANLDSANHE